MGADGRPRMATSDELARRVALLTMPPLDPRGGTRRQQFAAHLAKVRPYLDEVYREGWVAGAAYQEARSSTRIMLVDKETLDRARKLADGGT